MNRGKGSGTVWKPHCDQGRVPTEWPSHRGEEEELHTGLASATSATSEGGGHHAPPPGEGRTVGLLGQAVGATWRRGQRRATEGSARMHRHTHAHEYTRTCAHTHARACTHAEVSTFADAQTRTRRRPGPPAAHLPLAVGLHQLAQRGVPLDFELDHGAVLPGHLQVDVVVLRLHALLQKTRTGP